MIKIIPISGGIDSAYLLAKALHEGHEVYPVEFDDGDLDHSESQAARSIVHNYQGEYHINGELLRWCHPMTSLRIPMLDQLKVRYPIQGHAAQTEAMKDTDYWSGYKALFYATTLAFGGAIGADQIEFGVYDWNDHFIDELPSSAHAFHKAWVVLYPDLKVPDIKFPLMGRSKKDILIDAQRLGLPFDLTYSCFHDNGPCGECLGCKHRAEEFSKAGLIDA